MFVFVLLNRNHSAFSDSIDPTFQHHGPTYMSPENVQGSKSWDANLFYLFFF